jgi:hypothetical protein
MKPFLLQSTYYLCNVMNIVKGGDNGVGGGGGREGLIELMRSWQLSRKKRERGGALLAWPTTAVSPHSTDHNGNLYF